MAWPDPGTTGIVLIFQSDGMARPRNNRNKKLFVFTIQSVVFYHLPLGHKYDILTDVS
jgi:hypothetical protein